MSDTPSFESVLTTIPKREQTGEETFTIALGDYFEGNTTTLVFCKLKASLLFGGTLPDVVERIKNQKCQEDEATINEMAFIVSCHREPPAEKPELLIPGYIFIFLQMDEIQKFRFVQEFKIKAGADFLAAVQQMTAAKKNDTENPKPPKTRPVGTSSASASATSSVTRPKRPSRLRKSQTSPLTTN